MKETGNRTQLLVRPGDTSPEGATSPDETSPEGATSVVVDVPDVPLEDLPVRRAGPEDMSVKNLEAAIRESWGVYRRHGRRRLEESIRLGGFLTALKRKLAGTGKGAFGKTCEAIGIKKSTSHRMRELYEHFGQLETSHIGTVYSSDKAAREAIAEGKRLVSAAEEAQEQAEKWTKHFAGGPLLDDKNTQDFRAGLISLLETLTELDNRLTPQEEMRKQSQRANGIG